MHKPINFEIINDHNLPLCFVGRGSLNTNLFNVVKHYRESIIVDIESLDSKLPEWVDNYQFGSFVSDIILKEKIVSKLNDNQAKFFSIIGPNNVVHPSVTIGHNTFINNYNDFVTGDFDKTSV